MNPTVQRIVNLKGTMLLMLALCFFSIKSYAQVSTYVFQQKMETYTLITGGTVIGSGTIDDNSYSGRTLPFPFVFEGITYTTYGINANGFIMFGSGTVTSSYTAVASYNNVISGINFDLQGLATGELREQTLGTAPNRVHIYQWKNFAPWSSATYVQDTVNFQIQLFETSNVIKIVAGDVRKTNTTVTSRNAQSGIRGGSAAEFQNRMVTNGVHTWLTSVKGTAASSSATIANTTLVPPKGLTFQYRPRLTNDVRVNALVSPTNTCSAVAASTMTVTVENIGSASQSNIPVKIDVSGAGTHTQTFTIPGPVAPGTTNTFSFPTQLNTSGGGLYTFKVYTQLAGDQYTEDDTLITAINIGSPSSPTLTPGQRCGVGTVNLSGTPTNPTDVIHWFNSSTSSTILGTGNSFTTPSIASTTTFYAESRRPSGAGFCASPRVSVVASVGAPLRTNIIPGTPFTGTYNSFLGPNFDFVRAGDVTTYQLQEPIGFLNSNHGSTWAIIAMSFRTVNNTPVNPSDTLTTLPGASNGTFRYTAPLTWGDSTLQLSITIKNILTNCDTTIIRKLYVAHRPVPNFSASAVCAGSQSIFVNSSSIPKGSLSFFWDMGDGTTTGARSPRHTYSNAGTYNVKLIVTSNFGFKDSVTKSVTIHETANASFNPRFACQSDQLVFTNNSTGPAGTTYNWNFGDGNSSTSTSPTYMYAAPGTYIVTLTATTSNACISSVKKSVFQFPDPVSNFTSVANCQDDEVLFTNGSSISNGVIGYTWNFGDNSGSEVQNPKHVYQNPGTYNVSLITTSFFGCDDTITKQVTVMATPKAGFTANNVCKGGTTDFANASTIAAGNTFTSSWDFNDGNTSNSLSPSHTFASTGTYAVKLTVSNGVCSDEVVKTVEVFEKPVAGFNVANTCLGKQSLFVNTSNLGSGGVNYSWNLGDGNTSTSTNVAHIYTTAGQKTIWLKVNSEAGCADSTSKVAEIFPIPSSDFTFTHVERRKYTFTTTSTGTFNWTFGDAARSSTQNPTYDYFFDANFSVCLTVTSTQGCESTTCKPLLVNTTGVESLEAEASHISVYPNPSNGTFTVKSINNEYSVSVYDVYGKLIKEVPSGSVIKGEVNIEMTGNAAGVYLLKINEAGKVSVKRITLK